MVSPGLILPPGKSYLPWFVPPLYAEDSRKISTLPSEIITARTATRCCIVFISLPMIAKNLSSEVSKNYREDTFGMHRTHLVCFSRVFGYLFPPAPLETT